MLVELTPQINERLKTAVSVKCYGHLCYVTGYYARHPTNSLNFVSKSNPQTTKPAASTVATPCYAGISKPCLILMCGCSMCFQLPITLI